MPPPLLLRGSLAGVGEIRPSPAPLPPRTGLRSGQHPSAALEEKQQQQQHGAFCYLTLRNDAALRRFRFI